MNQVAAFDETLALAEERGMPELPGSSVGLAHMREMRGRIQDSFSDAKLGRWLGWAQAMLVAADTGLTLEDVKQINLRHADVPAPRTITVLHVEGFTDKRGVREVKVSSQEAETVAEVARRTIEHATASEHTELVRFNRTWPLDGYGREWAVVQVDAVTRTTLDGGKTWSEMWHWFGTASTPWPLADEAEVSRGK